MSDYGLSLALQFWGGVFYLLNKIFFALKENRSKYDKAGERFWRVRAWTVYIIGAPAWLIILYQEDKFMTLLVETGGLPSMALGLLIATRHNSKSPMSQEWKTWTKRLDWLAWTSAVLGVLVSFYVIGMMTDYTQWLELGIVLGFLVGTYRLTHDHLDGYLWFLLMNGSAGALVFVEGYPILGVQQILSLGFVLYAFVKKSRRS